MNENLETNYLSHHGIDGMKWGKRNGPPYPLSRVEHNKVVSKNKKSGATKRDPKTGRFVKGKVKKKKSDELTDKQKAKILKNPKKIIKYQEKLTRDEIEEALLKMSSVDKVKARVNKRKLFSRRDSGLSKRQRRMARDPNSLLKNMHKFSPEDLQKAINYLTTKNAMFDLKLKNADKPRRVVNEVSDYIKTFSDLIKNWNSFKDNVVTLKNVGLKNEENRKKWMYTNDPLMYRLLNADAAAKMDIVAKEAAKQGLSVEEFLRQDDMNREDYLEHYGVKGMKWRHHKYAQREDPRDWIRRHSDKEDESSRSPYASPLGMSNIESHNVENNARRNWQRVVARSSANAERRRQEQEHNQARWDKKREQDRNREDAREALIARMRELKEDELRKHRHDIAAKVHEHDQRRAVERLAARAEQRRRGEARRGRGKVVSGLNRRVNSDLNTWRKIQRDRKRRNS